MWPLQAKPSACGGAYTKSPFPHWHTDDIPSLFSPPCRPSVPERRAHDHHHYYFAMRYCDRLIVSSSKLFAHTATLFQIGRRHAQTGVNPCGQTPFFPLCQFYDYCSGHIVIHILTESALHAATMISHEHVSRIGLRHRPSRPLCCNAAPSCCSFSFSRACMVQLIFKIHF
jgi:hypothetical protein